MEQNHPQALSSSIPGSFHESSLKQVLTFCSSKYKPAVLWELLKKEPQSYLELRHSAGPVTNTTLTRVLSELEQEHLISRRTPDPAPYGDEFLLTDIGRDFSKVLEAMGRWGDELRIRKHRRSHPASVKRASLDYSNEESSYS